jgi:UTP--glucose-1-phosphate uridylyltransferase
VKVSQMVEKPKPEDAPSRLGVAGRYILTPGVFGEIRNQPKGAGGEIQLTDGIAALMKKESVYAYVQGHPLRLRQQGRLPASHRRAGAGAPRSGREFREYLKSLKL